jgi:hypothetical protein
MRIIRNARGEGRREIGREGVASGPQGAHGKRIEGALLLRSICNCFQELAGGPGIS